MTGTEISNYDADDFAERLIRNGSPGNWAGDEHKAPGGTVYELNKAIGTNLEFNQKWVQFVFNASRIATATDTALDRISVDFFGSQLPRTPGEVDDSFRERIYQQLLADAVTRGAIAKRIAEYTGHQPDLREPWNPMDTCAWDKDSYWDVDQPGNPFRWGAPEMRYQGFGIINLPSPQIQGGRNVYGWDQGFFWDTYQGTLWQPSALWYLSADDVDALIRRIKAAGTIFWRRYQTIPPAPATNGVAKVTAGSTQWTVPVTGLPHGIAVQPSWITTVSLRTAISGAFIITFGTPAPPGGGTMDWTISKASVHNYGTQIVTQGNNYVDITIPAGLAGGLCYVLPNWNTSRWIDSIAGGVVRVKFAQSAPAGASITYRFLDPAKSFVRGESGGALNDSFMSGVTPPFAAIIMPGWNANVAIGKSGFEILAKWDTPSPSGGQLYWATT